MLCSYFRRQLDRDKPAIHGQMNQSVTSSVNHQSPINHSLFIPTSCLSFPSVKLVFNGDGSGFLTTLSAGWVGEPAH